MNDLTPPNIDTVVRVSKEGSPSVDVIGRFDLRPLDFVGEETHGPRLLINHEYINSQQIQIHNQIDEGSQIVFSSHLPSLTLTLYV